MIIAIVPMGCGAHVYHIVERGETLYSIGWLYGYDYRAVAEWNQIKAPYHLRVGQRLRVTPLASQSSHLTPYVGGDKKSITENKVQSKGHMLETDKRNKYNQFVKTQRNVNSIKWLWPAKGKIVNRFVVDDPGKKGIDIVGPEGQPVTSASSGKVVYSGAGLPRYGKLIIVKHNETFLSAYAHNKQLLVKEGDVVKSGQKIAIMGKTGISGARLHFEIRRHGKPIDPLLLLPSPIPKQSE